MVNNILLFVLYSLFICVFFYIAPVRFRKAVLLVASFSFYYFAAGYIIVLFCTEIAWSYFCSRRIISISIDDSKRFARKLWMWVGIIPVACILVLYKSLDMLAYEIHCSEPITVLLVPLGLSFSSLKLISYIVQVYGQRIRTCSLIDYALYVMIFTEIMSGPVSRPSDMIPCFGFYETSLSHIKARFEEGLFRVVVGLFKKLSIANRIAPYVDSVYRTYKDHSSLALFFCAILYSIQIYADFSGYSDIVIGVMHIIGIDIPENFRAPYFAGSIRDFWKRWHISLSEWLTDNIYIPLGGNRGSKVQRFINVIITFLVSGFWHGNGIHYLVWGLGHGIFVGASPKGKTSQRKVKLFIETVFTFLIVTILWIFFRSESVVNAIDYIVHLFRYTPINASSIANTLLPFTNDDTCGVYALVVIAEILIMSLYDWLIYERSDVIRKNKYLDAVFEVAFIMSIVLFGINGESRFIYAQF